MTQHRIDELRHNGLDKITTAELDELLNAAELENALDWWNGLECKSDESCGECPYQPFCALPLDDKPLLIETYKKYGG
jgi:hypothetical protein